MGIYIAKTIKIIYNDPKWDQKEPTLMVPESKK